MSLPCRAGESSPTCVIRNSALRSNSCSPTMSTISKASSEVDRQDYVEAKQPRTKCGGNSPSEDDEGFFGASPGSDLQKVGRLSMHVGDRLSLTLSTVRPLVITSHTHRQSLC